MCLVKLVSYKITLLPTQYIHSIPMWIKNGVKTAAILDTKEQLP